MARAQALRLPWMGIPVALWTASAVFDFASLSLGHVAVHAAFFCVSGGFATALLIAAGSGLGYNHVPAGNRLVRFTMVHGAVQLATLIVFAFDTWVRAAWYDVHTTPMSAVLLNALGLTLVAVGAFLSRQVALDRGGTVVRLPLRP